MSDTIRNMDGAGSAIDYWPSSHAHMELDLHSRSPMQSIIGRKRGRSLTSKQHNIATVEEPPAKRLRRTDSGPNASNSSDQGSDRPKHSVKSQLERAAEINSLLVHWQNQRRIDAAEQAEATRMNTIPIDIKLQHIVIQELAPGQIQVSTQTQNETKEMRFTGSLDTRRSFASVHEELMKHYLVSFKEKHAPYRGFRLRWEFELGALKVTRENWIPALAQRAALVNSCSTDVRPPTDFVARFWCEGGKPVVSSQMNPKNIP